jgi:hypothetical protein
MTVLQFNNFVTSLANISIVIQPVHYEWKYIHNLFVKCDHETTTTNVRRTNETLTTQELEERQVHTGNYYYL